MCELGENMAEIDRRQHGRQGRLQSEMWSCRMRVDAAALGAAWLEVFVPSGAHPTLMPTLREHTHTHPKFKIEMRPYLY